MFCSYKYYTFIVIFAVMFCLFPVNHILSFTIQAPIIINVDLSSNASKPLIVGLTQPGTEVMIYIDGNYFGEAEINEQDTGTDNFYYQVIENLVAGEHTVEAIAKDRTSLVLSPASSKIQFNVPVLPAPTLIQPNENTVTGKVKPLIAGLTVNNSYVHFYIDGIYNGKTQNLVHESVTANFAYKPFLNLSVGQHTVWAIAEDHNGRKSQASNLLKFNIEEPMPAPTLFTPVVNNQTVYNQPFIVGLAKNDSLIKIYIDQKLNGQFKVENHESGTSNFAYKPFLPLTEGGHMVYTEAIDIRGKVSVWSNIVYFNISRSIQPAITAEAAEEEISQEKKIDVLSETMEAEEEVIPVEEEAKEEAGEEIGDIEEILQPEEGEQGEETGLIDESRQQQGKLRWNLIIFILFLIAVIAWIFWVNRELIKERREKNKEEKSPTGKT